MSARKSKSKSAPKRPGPSPAPSPGAPARSPRVLRTPTKAEQPGIPRTVFTHASTLQDLMRDWQSLQDKGTGVCKAVAALRLHEMMEGEYPDKLGSLTDALDEALNGLNLIIEGIQTIDKQLDAVAKLQPSDDPVISEWSASKISQEIHEVRLSYEQEYALKKTVAENIAHCRNENITEVYVSAWEFEVYVERERTDYLFADVGLLTAVT